MSYGSSSSHAALSLTIAALTLVVAVFALFVAIGQWVMPFLPVYRSPLAVTAEQHETATGPLIAQAEERRLQSVPPSPHDRRDPVRASATFNTGETRCSGEAMPDGVMQRPPNWDDLKVSMAPEPHILDGRIVDKSLERHNRLVIDVQMMPKHLGKIGILIGPTTKIRNRCEAGGRDLLRCGQFVRVSLPAGYDTQHWGFWASDVWLMKQDDVGQPIDCRPDEQNAAYAR